MLPIKMQASKQAMHMHVPCCVHRHQALPVPQHAFMWHAVPNERAGKKAGKAADQPATTTLSPDEGM